MCLDLRDWEGRITHSQVFGQQTPGPHCAVQALPYSTLASGNLLGSREQWRAVVSVLPSLGGSGHSGVE